MIDNQTNLAGMSVNIAEKPFGDSFNMQSQPPFGAQYTGPSATSNLLSPTSWATEIMEDIKSIKSSVAKIALKIWITLKVDTLETQVKTIDTRVKEVEKSKESVSSEFEDTKKSADSDM